MAHKYNKIPSFRIKLPISSHNRVQLYKIKVGITLCLDIWGLGSLLWISFLYDLEPKNNCLILILPSVNLLRLFFSCLHKTTQQRVMERSNTSSTNSICLPHMLWYHSKLNNQLFIWNDNTKIHNKEVDFIPPFNMSHTTVSRLYYKAPYEKVSE